MIGPSNQVIASLAATTPQMDPTGSWLVVCFYPSEKDEFVRQLG